MWLFKKIKDWEYYDYYSTYEDLCGEEPTIRYSPSTDRLELYGRLLGWCRGIFTIEEEDLIKQRIKMGVYPKAY